jgi:hypothetical protein
MSCGRRDKALRPEQRHLGGLSDVSAATDRANLMGDRLGAGVRLTAALDRVFAGSLR